VRVWIATGHTDMRRGMNSLALQVREALKRDPHGGDLYVFRGKSGQLVKILWHDGLGMSLYAKRLERGRFISPSSAAGAVVITPAQLSYMLEGIESTQGIRNSSGARKARGEKNNLQLFALDASQRIRSVIHCVAWVLIAKRFPIMSLP
jgi:transposase